MSKAYISSLFKNITVLSIISLILTIVLLITMTVRGHRSFPSSVPVATYFQRKYSTRSDIGFKLGISSISLTIICLVILIVIVLKASCQQSGSDSSSADIARLIFIMISICLLTLVPVALFYAALFVQRYKLQKQAYWDKISMFSQGILQLTLILIGGTTVSHHLLTEEKEKACSQRRLERDLGENINQQLFNMQKSLQQDRQSNQKGVLYENLFDNIRENLLEDYNQGQQAKKLIIRSMKKQREEYKNYESKGPHRKSNQNIKKSSKRQQAERLYRQLLKEEIEKRKKKFRQINPHAAHHHTENLSEISQQSEQGHKMSNLPKTYRQYIKQAKRPKRRTPTINQLAKQIEADLLESIIHQNQVGQEGILTQIAPIMIQGLREQSGYMERENQQNPNFSKLQAKIKQYKRKKLIGVKGMQADEESVSTIDLFKKMDMKKISQETVMGNATKRIYFDNFQFEAQPPKTRRKAEPSREQQIIVKLKDRHDVQQADD